MLEKLRKLAENAYVPYSHYPVSTILVMKDGKEIPGVCVDNACYGSSICAERNAVFSAVTMGYRKGDFRELHCLCAESRKVSTSCFACRQVISEFFEKDAPLYFYASSGEMEEYTVAELCPYPFDADDLQ